MKKPSQGLKNLNPLANLFLIVSLVPLIFSTIIYWIVIISITVNLALFNATDTKISDENSQQLNDDISTIIDKLSLTVLYWVILTLSFLALKLLINKFKIDNKALFYATLITVFASSVSVVFSQMIIRSFISNL